MTVDQRAFRHAMGQFASGVTVVTTCDDARPVGTTVSSFASLSLDPPLVLVCIGKRGRSHDAIEHAGVFAVNILADHQEHVARLFASRADDKFVSIDYRYSLDDLPILDGVLATIECRVISALPGGDHTIFVGEVVRMDTQEGRPLVYHRGQFGQFSRPELLEQPALAQSSTRQAELDVTR